MKTIIKKTDSGKPDAINNSALYDFFILQLYDIYWVKKHQEKIFSKMQKLVSLEELRQMFRDHQAETEKQEARLEEIFDLLGIKAQAKKCEAMEGLIRETETIIEQTQAGTSTRDAALIIAVQKIQHYEIASYGGLAQLATTLGLEKICGLLSQSLQEEKDADILLSDIAERKVNWLAETEEKV